VSNHPYNYLMMMDWLIPSANIKMMLELKSRQHYLTHVGQMIATYCFTKTQHLDTRIASHHTWFILSQLCSLNSQCNKSHLWPLLQRQYLLSCIHEVASLAPSFSGKLEQNLQYRSAPSWKGWLLWEQDLP
jgi:deoxyribodipyrimidine photolyase